MHNNLFQDNMVWKCGGYTRLSDDDKDKEISNSILNQEKMIRNFCEKEPSIELQNFYNDDGYTGTNFNRPSFTKMMTDIHAGIINCIIVKDLSRFGREHIEVCQFLQIKFPSWGVRFISIAQNIDSYKNPSKIYGYEIPMWSVVLETYAIDTSNKTKANLKAKREAGEYIGTYLPYGYMRSTDVKNQLVVDENISINVQRIFNMYIAGNSMTEICNWLNSNEILSPIAYWVKIGVRKRAINAKAEDFGQWQCANIKRVLSCDLYTGDMVQGKTASYSHKLKTRIPLPEEKWVTVKNTHEPIIMRETFRNAQELLGKQQKPKTTTNTSPSFLAGYIYCADCGKAMVRNTQKKGGRCYSKFTCTTFKKDGKEACSSHYIDEEVIIKVLLFCIQTHIESLEDVGVVTDKMAMEQNAQRASANYDRILSENQSKMEEVSCLLRGLYGDYKKGIFTTDEYHNIKIEFEKERQALSAVIEEKTNNKMRILNVKREYGEHIEEFIKYKNITKLTRSIVVSLVQKVLIYEERKIKIIFKYEEQLQRLDSIFVNS